MSSARPPERRYTFMVVPDGGRGEVRQISVTVAQLRRWGMIAAGVSALALVALLFLITTLPRGLAYRALFDENVALKAQLQDIERRLDEVDDALRRLRLYDAQLEGLPPSGLSDQSSYDESPVDEAPAAPAAEEGAGEEPPEESPSAEVPADEQPAPAKKRGGPSLGFEGEHGENDVDSGAEGPELPDTLSPTLQWALAVADRVRRTAIVVQAALPKAGMMAENAEAWLTARDSLPSLWPVNGIITSRFGYRRNPMNRSRWQFHSGLDIGVPYGTIVRAPGPGVIIRADYDSGKGNYVEIDHGHGVISRLNHNSQIFVSVGELVTRGQPVAAAGSTGQSTGPHCHYSVLVNGDYVDPLLYLPRRDRS